MAWQARNSDNSPRTPSPYVRHNSANEVVAGGLLGQNAYVRHNESCFEDNLQPSSSLQTDAYGNQFYNWNADYGGIDPSIIPLLLDNNGTDFIVTTDGDFIELS